MSEKEYNDMVEKMSIAIHESWMRSRKSIMDQFGTDKGIQKQITKINVEKMIPKATEEVPNPLKPDPETVEVMNNLLSLSRMRSKFTRTKNDDEKREVLEKAKKKLIKDISPVVDKVGFVMNAKWYKDMTPYDDLPDDVKEWDRFEARGILAMNDILPPYMTAKELDKYNQCVNDKEITIHYYDKEKLKFANKDEAKIGCFRALKLQCTKDWKEKQKKYCEYK